MTTSPALPGVDPAVTARTEDEIDALLGPAAAPLRAARPAARTHAQGAFDALFRPADPRGVAVAHRHAVALRVAVLAEQPALAARHRAALPRELADAVAAPQARVADPVLAALLAHADLLTLRPAEATPDALTALHAVGLDATDVLTATQLIAFVHFQLRVVAGLGLQAVRTGDAR